MDVYNIMKSFENMTPEQIKKFDDEYRAQEAQYQAKERAKRYKASGVPERYLDEGLNTYNVKNEMQKTAKEAALKYLQEIKCGAFKSLVFIGNAGTGKTHLACGIIRNFDGAKYKSAPEIVEEIRQAKSFTSHETEAEIISYYGRVPLLVIDEIGRGIAATDEKYMLYQVLNARYNTRRPTVLISNFSKSDFLQYIGVAAADRLVESADIIELRGDSYRAELRGAK